MKFPTVKQVMINFATNFAAGLDNIERHEADTSTIQAVITTLLVEMGYELTECYAVTIAMDMAMEPIGGVKGGYEFENNAVTLASLLTTACMMIDENKIPQELLDKVRGMKH